ncbi:MAG: ABC transporter substrate-binding protein [Anaerolineales bacterium]|nr:ABC transporter substrate-binding protein [Anaerolineales bacterium]
MMRFFTYALSILLIAALIGGCAVNAAPTPGQAVQTQQVESPGSEPASFSVTDALGQELNFERPPERIALAGRGVFMLADAIFAFPQASERLVAIGRTDQWQSDFIPLVDPRYAEKTILETESGPEQIAAAQPDLVILKSFLKEQLGAPLEALGIPVVYLDFETPDQYPRDIAILGQIFQDAQRAGQISAYYQEEMESIESALQGLSEEDKPRLLILYYSNKDGQVAFNAPPSGWIQTQIATLAGGRPVWLDIELSGGWTKVNFEQVAAWDADQIYIVAYTSDAVQVVEELKSAPEWASLRAVREQQLYAFPADFYSWDQPDTRWILGLTWLASKAHPERFEDLDMRQKVTRFYQELYGLSDQAIQEHIFPLLEGELP